MKRDNLLDKNLLISYLIVNLILFAIFLPEIILFWGTSNGGVFIGLGVLIVFPIFSLFFLTWCYFTEV